MILDMTCGSKMMWFDKNNPDTVYMDQRVVDTTLGDGRRLEIKPTVVGDFTALPFMDAVFDHVVFDPPHLQRAGSKSWLAQKYGVLTTTWREEITEGFKEGFRVLKNNGTLIFKWNSYHIPLNDVLSLTSMKPAYGHTGGRQSKTHWVVFVKNLEEKQ